MTDISQNISRNLRELRKERQLTLEELAEASGVSRSMLGEIERGRTNPTVTVLWKIAQALHIPLTSLIDEQPSLYALSRRAEQKTVDSSQGHSITSVFPYYDRHHTELLSLTLAPGAVLSNPGHAKGVDEVLIVQSGAIRVQVKEERVELQAGDALRFAADVPHSLTSLGKDTAVILNLIHYGAPDSVTAR